MKKADTESKVTVKAVLQEAQRLRDRAVKERQADPWARPYDPSDAAARTLSQAVGPERAILTLRERADDAREEYREQCEQSERARKRHVRRMRLHEAEQRQRRSGMSPGARLDECLAGLVLLSESKASQMDASPISQGKAEDRIPPKGGDRFGSARQEALLLIAKLEDKLSEGKRRLVEREDAAA